VFSASISFRVILRGCVLCFTGVALNILGSSWSYGSWIYSYLCNQFLSSLTLRVRIPPRRGVCDKILCDQVYQWVATGRWFSPGPPVSSINKSDRHDLTEILLKVALSIITLTIEYPDRNCTLPSLISYHPLLGWSILSLSLYASLSGCLFICLFNSVVLFISFVYRTFNPQQCLINLKVLHYIPLPIESCFLISSKFLDYDAGV
jgi:hypothetical protein